MPRDTVAEIKNRLSIQDVVAPYVKLIKAGRSMKGLCPFHKEKTPSFNVSIDRGTYHCFGCGEGGDMFSFIEKVEGVDFRGALTILAEKAGVEVVYDPKAREVSSRAERLREAMAKAADFYVAHLSPQGEAYGYALARGLTPKTIKEWQLGYAPNEWRLLLEHMSSTRFTVEELRLAGLVKEADGKPGTYYDRFRNRLMFPIRDTAGRVVAFTGRILPASGSEAKQEEAKYLNSPDTELYHKSQILFGMDKAKEAIRTRGFALLVEGQMDLLLAHEAGFANTVALSGTAFTSEHARLLKRYSENLMLALDADSAGLTATQKSALVALLGGMRVKVVRLPKDKDPADVVREDPKSLASYVKAAIPVVDFFLAILGEREKDQHRLVLASERVVLPLIAAMGSPMERAHFVENTARTLGLAREAVQAALTKLPKEGLKDGESISAPSAPTARISPRVAKEEMLRGVVAVYPKTELAKRIKAEYARITEAHLSKAPTAEAALFAVEEAFGESPPEGAADELLQAFELAYVREAYQEAIGKLRGAERAGEAVHIAKVEREVAELGKRLAALQ